MTKIVWPGDPEHSETPKPRKRGEGSSHKGTKLGSQSREHRRNLIIGKYKAMYGDGWKEVLEERQKNWSDIRIRKLISELQNVTLYPPNILDLTTPIVEAAFLSKLDLLRLVAGRLRDPRTTTPSFWQLALMYCELKGWVNTRRTIFAKKQKEDEPEPVDLSLAELEQQLKEQGNEQRHTEREETSGREEEQGHSSDPCE